MDIKELRDRINDDDARIRSVANDIIGPTWEELVSRHGNHPEETSIQELRDKIKHRAMINRVLDKEIDNVLNKLVCLDDQTKERLFWLGG